MLKSLEFELPMVSTAFLILLVIVYISKERIKLPENQMFNLILLFSLIESVIDTFIHILCAFVPFEVISTKYYFLINYLNKILAILFIMIFVSYLKYILMITYQKVLDNIKRINIASYIFYFIVFIILQFTNIKLVKVTNVTNVIGLTPQIAYLIVGICLISSLAISIPKLSTKDERFYSVVSITVMLVVFMLLTILVPGIIIYDLVLALMCYIMYFTIENPDVKMIKQLDVAREQADKANQAKTDFLSSMSHEIRTPLNAIVGFSDEILESKNLEEAQENAKDIVNASDTLLEIVNGILDISKIEAGKIEIINTPYNAPETFEELAKLITPKMKEKGLDFTYNIAPDLPETLFGDHANIKKVVTNFLSNACKYTDRGYVHYEVNCVNTDNVCKLIISVEDSGRGIKKESVDKMFTKFQRFDEDKNATIEGTGLGLAITKQLVELMGGRVIVHTVYGEGSKFTAVLNQKIEQTKVQEKQKISTNLDLNNISILIVDDNPLNLKVACKLLERYGANQLKTCDSGFECLDCIKNGEHYDLILLDDLMPKMSGIETLNKLKEIPEFNVPTIALTANAITGMREKYLADGFDDYLAKPIEKMQLIQVVNQILGRSEVEESISKEERSGEIKQESENVQIEENNEEEQKNTIIPIEENIEEVLGSQLDRNYEEEKTEEPDIL